LNANYLSQLMMVGAGGFIGSMLRFGLGGWVQRLAATAGFPYGTFVVNISGCLVIGFVAGIAEYRQIVEPGYRLFLIVGVLGGFTTFSAFAYDTLALLQDSEFVKALANSVLQVVLGCTATFIGYVGSRLF
jgi:CrcB protein